LNVAKEIRPDLYAKGMELMTKDNPYYQQVVNSKEYGKIINKMRDNGVSEADIEAYIKEESLATAIGDKGESFASAAQEKNFKNWLNELFDFIRKLVGISKMTAEQLQNITLDEFLQGVTVDIMSENEAFVGAEVKSLGEQLQLMVVPEKSMGDIINYGRSEQFSDASIKQLLKKRGFKVEDINNAMVVEIGVDVKMPNEFSSIKGGVSDAIELFEDTRKKLSRFAKGKRKKIKTPTLTAEEKKSKANQLRNANPSIFELTDDQIMDFAIQ
jgi:DNA-binding transcriptional MerR regulator